MSLTGCVTRVELSVRVTTKLNQQFGFFVFANPFFLLTDQTFTIYKFVTTEITDAMHTFPHSLSLFLNLRVHLHLTCTVVARVTDHSSVGISLLDCYLWMNRPELCMSSALTCLRHFGASVILIQETIRTSVDSQSVGQFFVCQRVDQTASQLH